MPHIVKKPKVVSEPTGPRVLGASAPKAAPASISPIGRWHAFHSTWQSPIEIKVGGLFTAGGRGSGTWLYDGRYLTLTWSKNRPSEVLEIQGDGTFYRMCPEGSFTLRRM